MGGSNARALMSQNIVAICDVDDSLRREDARRTTRRSLNPTASSRQGGSGNQTQPKRTAAQVRRQPATAPRRTRWRTCGGSWTSSCRRSSATRTTGRCSTSRRISTASSSRRRITCTRSSRRRRWTSASTSTCRSRSAGRCRRRDTSPRRRRATKLVTQMGNQGHSRDEARLGYEYITSGAIGEIREVHVWTNRPLGYWPQGVPRPAPPARERRSSGTARASRRGSRPRSAPATRCRRSSPGTCSSASRRRSTITRSITRSTGADGWTGVRARSATWART